MSIYGIYGAQLDINGRVLRAVIRQIDPNSRKWNGSVHVLQVNQIASLLANGNTVFGVFTSRDDHMQETLHGPKLKRAVYFNGIVGVELEENELGRTVHDLVQHVSASW